MLCQFERLVYPKTAQAVTPTSYMVAIYRPCEKLMGSAGTPLTQIKAVGFCLPLSGNLRYELKGSWKRDPKHGMQYEVEQYDEILIPTREGILAYLTSGQIKGVGPKVAEKIYECFGDQTLDILDHDPDQLLTVRGIGPGRLKRIRDSYLANRAARDVVAFLAPHGITANRAVKLFEIYGRQTLNIVQNHPYRLCEVAGISFHTADRIAMSMGLPRASAERVDQALLFTLADAESKGHLCMDKHKFISACLLLLDTPELTEEMLANRAARMLADGRLTSYLGFVYRERTAWLEQHLAEKIFAQSVQNGASSIVDINEEISAEEAHLKIRFAAEQKAAIETALTERLTVITGGPGTGKTMIQKAILDIYQKHNPKAHIVCCAPTGRAARRMEESTGHPASTVHRAIGLYAGDDGSFGTPTPLTADLLLVDEISMLDIYVASALFDAVKPGCQVVLIGDADQLPSVGPGAVLSEMIASGCVPVVRLDKVYRQQEGSRIAINAKLIRHGNLALEYGSDFQFVNSPQLPDSAEAMVQLYLQEVRRCGVDNVALLTPYRQKTETSVNALNQRLRDLLNPPMPGKAEVSCGSRVFRCGDKVMQTRNFRDVSNGDIGYITSIHEDGDDTLLQVNFGGRIAEYDLSMLDQLDLGYASTVHKSQGAEYRSVILNLQTAHYIMLTRPLVYTAITRGKEKVIIVGERRALCMAISRTDAERRGTCLAHRLRTIKSENRKDL